MVKVLTRIDYNPKKLGVYFMMSTLSMQLKWSSSFYPASNESCINRGCNSFLNGILEFGECIKQYLAFILSSVFLRRKIFYLENSKKSFHHIFLLSLTKEYLFLQRWL